MAMTVGPAEGDEDEVVSTINTTPLVDVMLVLLIIFLITVPVDSIGHIYWNDLRIQNTQALIDRLKKVSVLRPQPEVQIRGDGGADYEGVGRVIYACQRAGISKIGFITEPPVRGG